MIESAGTSLWHYGHVASRDTSAPYLQNITDDVRWTVSDVLVPLHSVEAHHVRLRSPGSKRWWCCENTTFRRGSLSFRSCAECIEKIFFSIYSGSCAPTERNDPAPELHQWRLYRRTKWQWRTQNCGWPLGWPQFSYAKMHGHNPIISDYRKTVQVKVAVARQGYVRLYIVRVTFPPPWRMYTPLE